MGFVVAFSSLVWAPVLIIAVVVLGALLPWILVARHYARHSVPADQRRIKWWHTLLMSIGSALAAFPAAIVLCLVILMGAMWFGDDYGSRATRQYFEENRPAYEAFVEWCRDDSVYNEFGSIDEERIPEPYRDLIAEGFRVQRDPALVLEMTPVNFYSVIVYAETDGQLQETSVVAHDLGHIEALDGPWHLVVRDWN